MRDKVSNDFEFAEIPATGAVFMFGKSHLAETLPNQFWVNNDKVVDISCGDQHTVLAAASGRVFVFGSNAHGQLGLGHTNTVSKPTCIKSLKGEKVKLVACGRAHTVFSTESGLVYSCGSNSEGQLGFKGTSDVLNPQQVKGLEQQQYKMLSCGTDHTVVLNEEGNVYVWGCGDEGKLGLGGEESCLSPAQLELDESVTCISCGYYHTALVTVSGKLYTFGEMDDGKLGLERAVEEALKPHMVSIPEKVVQVSCGGSHTAALTENGLVYTFGDGGHGQLGHGTHTLQSTSPLCLKLDFKATSVCCGENFTAIMSDTGYLYTCGNGRHGRLAQGFDSYSNQFKPRRVDGFQNYVVHKVACGGCHMVVLAQKRSEKELRRRRLEKTKKNDVIEISAARSRRHRILESNTSLNRTMPELALQKLIPTNLNFTMPHPVSRKPHRKPRKTKELPERKTKELPEL